MNIDQALAKADETLRAAAVYQSRDKGAKSYTAEMHSQAVGLAMRQVFAPKEGSGLEPLAPTTANYTTMFHALYNHSAWRQKFEKKGKDGSAPLFAKKEGRTVVDMENELENEIEGS